MRNERKHSGRGIGAHIMRHIFMDESGEPRFGVGTDYFVLALISPERGKKLSKTVKSFNAHLINHGWNPDI
jgi:hypothetical protein